MFEDVNVEDKQAGVNSLDGKVDSMMLDYDELATDEKSEDDIKLDVDLFTSKIAKFVENYENEDKQKVLTEVLNDVKLLLQPTTNNEVH